MVRNRQRDDVIDELRKVVGEQKRLAEQNLATVRRAEELLRKDDDDRDD